MRVLIFEDNLMWSARLKRSIESFGYTAHVSLGHADETGDVAILNLSWDRDRIIPIVQALKARGVKTIGHAGHKEQPLITFGLDMGVDRVVSNSTLTYKLKEVLDEVVAGISSL